MMSYDYVIVGAGIAGCSVAHFLQNEDVLLIDRNEDVAFGASGAAGAFLSPLLGKPNNFKSLVSKALTFSVDFYKEKFPLIIHNDGVIRIAKNSEDKKKFESYKPYMDFEFSPREEGYYFKIGSRINPSEICKALSQFVEKKFNYEIKHIKYENNFWILNDKIKTKHLILTTGADTSLITEKYFSIRAVWGQKIDITTTTCIDVNYHKECSLSSSTNIDGSKLNLVSIGATHRRFECDAHICNHCLTTANINKMYSSGYTKSVMNSDTQELLQKANDIKPLKNIEVVDIKIGARSSSVDYFPMVGELIDSKKTIDMFPHLKNGTHVKEERFTKIPQLFVLNGLGGRGFVLSPYLAKNLVELIKKTQNLESEIMVNRLFKRWVRKQK